VLAHATPLFDELALFEQLGATLARVKDEPKLAHECLTIALAALSAAQAIGRLKSTIDGTVVGPGIVAEASPAGVLISAGMTCTVVIKEGAAPKLGLGIRKAIAAILGPPSS
jgi:hypothetical protein